MKGVEQREDGRVCDE